LSRAIGELRPPQFDAIRAPLADALDGLEEVLETVQKTAKKPVAEQVERLPLDDESEEAA
jgi:hypothetical protein